MGADRVQLGSYLTLIGKVVCEGVEVGAVVDPFAAQLAPAQAEVSEHGHGYAKIVRGLAQLPEGVGGRRMALVIADLCRAGETLGWGSDLAPQVQPIDWKQTKHGRFAVTETCGKARYTSRGKVREVDLRCCPITIENHPRD